MCGIFGFTQKSQANSFLLLKSMGKTLEYRGPDDFGTYISDQIALGMRRLSIIDIEGGKQPFKSEDKNIVALYNGEIYNFKQLQKQLSKKHRFVTKSDGEVIVHLYEDFGEHFVNFLNGMFAIALWDAKQNKLILARDRLGEKPLYFTKQANSFIFASEPKAILNHPKVHKLLDYDSVARFFTFEYIPAPYSIFKGIYKLAPGQMLIFQKNSYKINNYWDINIAQQNNYAKDPTTLLEDKLQNSVKMRMQADVPQGVFLSGGLDSSTIAYFAQKCTNIKVKAFNISFEQKTFDESNWAKIVANYLGLELYQANFDIKECLNLIHALPKLLDEPFADASIMPTYLLSKFTRQKVKVCLSGDGADELFLGYPTFQAHKAAQLLSIMPKSIIDLVLYTLDHLPVSHSHMNLRFQLKRFFSSLQVEPLRRNQLWLGAFDPNLHRNLFAPNFLKKMSVDDPISESNKYLGLENFPFWQGLIYQYLKTYLAEDILTKIDRASMYCSLEVRAPFLDHQLVEFITSLPTEMKLKGYKTKFLLKKLMKGKLPDQIVERGKHGFGIPNGLWLKEDLKYLVKETFEEKKINKEGIFNSQYLKNIINEHISGKKDNRKLLWPLLTFELWKKHWLN